MTVRIATAVFALLIAGVGLGISATDQTVVAQPTSQTLGDTSPPPHIVFDTSAKEDHTVDLAIAGVIIGAAYVGQLFFGPRPRANRTAAANRIAAAA